MKRLVVGISGASGMPIAIEILRVLKENPEWESCLVVSEGGVRTLEQETDYTLKDLEELADHTYPIWDIGASIASGTFKTEGMVVVPCSMKTLAGIHSGFSDNLLLRAADVTLKERRKLVLVARETPMSQIHLRNMAELAQMGVIMMPPMMTFYNLPKTIDDMVTHIAAKILDVYGIEHPKFKRWK